jgi:hypothetical protein
LPAHGHISTISLLTLLMVSVSSFADSFSDSSPVNKFEDIPDVRDEKTQAKFHRGDIVIVPIPTSDPTLGTGLILGGAYFYPQEPELAKVEPASMTAIAGLYTDNDSYGIGITQKNYWNEDNWRFSGSIGYADMKLDLTPPEEAAAGGSVDWLIEGVFAQAQISRQFFNDWYAGIQARYVNNTQTFSTELSDDKLSFSNDITTLGLGLVIELDRRDNSYNAYRGHYLQAAVLHNDEALGSSNSYTSYNAEFNSYHQILEPLVLAWQITGCYKANTPALWDACRVPLRGYAATKYLSKNSASTQLEARWKISQRWGVVAFGGGGISGTSLSASGDNETVPSAGLGLRFMVLTKQRINMRLDFAQSKDSEAVYLSVGEAF